MDDAFAEESPDADNSRNQHTDEPDVTQEGELSLEERWVEAFPSIIHTPLVVVRV